MMWIWSGLRVMKYYRTFFHVPITFIPLSSSLMKYLTLPFPSSTLLALYRKVNYPPIYTPNLPTPINTFCLAAVILLMWLRAYHTVKLLESGEFSQPTNLWNKRLGQLKNHLKRKGYQQSIIKKGFSKPHNISRSSLPQYKEKQKCKITPCVLTTPFVSIGHSSKKIPNCPKSFLSLHGCLQTTKQSEKPVGARRNF